MPHRKLGRQRHRAVESHGRRPYNDGGSVIDAAKGRAVVAQFRGHIRDYAGFGTGPTPFSRKIVAVPTTAGTGSEVSDGSVWIDDAATAGDKVAEDFRTLGMDDGKGGVRRTSAWRDSLNE